MKFPEDTPLWFQLVGKPQWIFVLQRDEAQTLTSLEDLMGFSNSTHEHLDGIVAVYALLRIACLKGVITTLESNHLRHWLRFHFKEG